MRYTLGRRREISGTVAVAFAAAAVAAAWQVWRNTYYVYGSEVKIGLFLLILLPILFLRGRTIFSVSTGRIEGICFVAAGVAGALFLGIPGAVPLGLVAIGVLISMCGKSHGARSIGNGLFSLGAVAGIQCLTVVLLSDLGAKMSTLPWVSVLLAKVFGWMGMETAVNDGCLVLSNAHFIWRFSPSPFTLGLIPIGAFTVSMVAYFAASGRRRAALCLAATAPAVILLRYVVLALGYLQWETMDWFFSPWLTLIGLLLWTSVVVLPAAFAEPAKRYLVAAGRRRRDRTHRLLSPAFALLTAGLAFFGLGMALPDPGVRKPGRLLVDEGHGGWEWSTESFDKEWYGGAATYNYYCVVDYVSKYFQTRHNHEEITDAVLKDTDLLLLKTPAKSFTPAEIESITRWVDNGGGLYVLGDHTNVFGMTTHLNPLMKRFGMEYCYDATYELQTGELQRADLGQTVRHPVLNGMPPRLLFGTSCSMLASPLCESVIVGSHLRSGYLDYGKTSFFGSARVMPHERYGEILQSTARRFGKGRVVAFSDSTIFSNFWTFFPGKSELFLGSLNWVNYRNTWGVSAWLTMIAGVAMMLYYRKRYPGTVQRGGQVALALFLAVPISVYARNQLTAGRYSFPPPQQAFRELHFDMVHTNIGLPDFGMQSEIKKSYQTFYTWVQKLGLVPRCAYDLNAVTEKDDGRLVMVFPSRELPDADLKRLDSFLRKGGRLLILDGPANDKSLVNLLSRRYGLAVDYTRTCSGTTQISGSSGLIPVQIDKGSPVEGGTPFMEVGGVPVASYQKVERGEVWLCSLGDYWSDEALGVSNANLTVRQQELSELLYRTLDVFANGEQPDAGGK